jgi:hypothetical protein
VEVAASLGLGLGFGLAWRLRLRGRGIQSNVYGDTDLSKVDEPVSARVVQLESRERELLELVQNQERMLRAKDDFEQLQNHNGSSRTSRDDFEETDESALVDTAHAITARLALLRTALAVRLQGQAPVDSEDAMVEVHQAGHLVHQKEKATLSNQNSNLKRENGALQERDGYLAGELEEATGSGTDGDSPLREGLGFLAD